MTNNDEDDFSALFWRDLKQVSTGLLAVTGDGDSHALPMTAHFESAGPLYFFAPAGGRIAESLAEGATDATFYYTGPDHDLYATVHGALEVSTDEEARHRFWTADVERWFPGKKSSPDVAFLSFDPEDGEVWLPNTSEDSAVLEMERRPVDVHAEVEL